MTRGPKPSVLGVGRCPLCGKMSYVSRSDAKRAARRVDPGAHFSAYRCEGGYWHFGKLAPPIARGTASRDGSRAYPPHVTGWAERNGPERGER